MLLILANRINVLEATSAVHDRVTDELKSQNGTLKEKVKELEYRVDDQEQRSRNSCLLFHGIVEVAEENTDDLVIDTVKDELGIEMSLDEIQRSHRLGAKRKLRRTRAVPETRRAIIIRFTDYRKRREIFLSKTKLKGKAVSISENLTQPRYQLLKAAITKYGRGNVWTSDGRVTTKVGNNYVVINRLEDLA